MISSVFKPFIAIVGIFVAIIFILVEADRVVNAREFVNQETADSLIELEEKNPVLTYQINTNKDGTYNLRFSNHSILPKYTWVYQNDHLYLDLPDSIFFGYARRAKLTLSNDDIFESQGWWCCGTNLADGRINPFQTFQANFTYDEIVKSAIWVLDFESRGDSAWIDPFGQELIELDNKGCPCQMTMESLNIHQQDSIQLSFFVDVYSVLDYECSRIESNAVSIAYADLLQERLLRERQDCLKFKESKYALN